MGTIRKLSTQVANSIAAGEVVERPSSVVKELCENALDAQATTLSVSIKNGGIASITVSDNGIGMDHDDALAAFDRHATSKLRILDDLESIGTMGFRGEALASIGAVSRTTIRTRQSGAEQGSLVRIEGGDLMEHTLTGCAEGTTVEVESLFYNTPARYKFLKKDTTEAGYVGDLVEKLALSRPDVSFRLTVNGKELLHTPGNNDLMSVLYAVYGRQTVAQCLPFENRQESILMRGVAGKPELARNTRARQILFVNGRLVHAPVFSAAVREAYRSRLVKGKHPFVLMKLEIPPNLLDVNVHPQKLEVRFWNDGDVYVSILRTLRSVLDESEQIPEEQDLTGTDPEPAIPQETPTQEDTAPRSDDPPPLQLEWVRDKPAADSSGTVSGYSIPDPDEKREEVPDDLKTAEPEDSGLFWSQARVAGVVFRTYVILEHGSDMLLLDQHAAHERILYEKLLYREDGPETSGAQLLLSPERIDLSAGEMQAVTEYQQTLESLGFAFDLFGSQSVVLRAIPANEREMNAQAAFLAALDDLSREIPEGGREQQREALLANMACKAAIKAGDRLDEQAARALLDRLSALRDPYHCPHGRPVLFKMSRRELEKRFRRIV